MEMESCVANPFFKEWGQDITEQWAKTWFCLRIRILPSRSEDVEGLGEHVVVDEAGVDREQTCECQGLTAS